MQTAGSSGTQQVSHHAILKVQNASHDLLAVLLLQVIIRRNFRTAITVKSHLSPNRQKIHPNRKVAHLDTSRTRENQLLPLIPPPGPGQMGHQGLPAVMAAHSACDDPPGLVSPYLPVDSGLFLQEPESADCLSE